MTLSNVNPFKHALRDGRTQIGMWLALANTYTAEICATAGFDWLLIDGEHAPNDIRSILGQLQVLAAYPVSPVVRATTGDSVLIKQLLDIGAQTLLIPMVETAEQARELVAAVRYPPRGIRGIGASISRVSRWLAFPDYLANGEEEICLLVQVESKLGLDNIADIAGIEGIDGVFLGPSDLAASLGHRGNPGHADVVSAIEGGIAAILKAGKPAGLLTPDERLARRYMELGATFVAVGTEATLLANSVRALAKNFDRKLP
jgi:4-hydroxy-2-oxoheptanedioate aldolase